VRTARDGVCRVPYRGPKRVADLLGVSTHKPRASVRLSTLGVDDEATVIQLPTEGLLLVLREKPGKRFD